MTHRAFFRAARWQPSGWLAGRRRRGRFREMCLCLCGDRGHDGTVYVYMIYMLYQFDHDPNPKICKIVHFKRRGRQIRERFEIEEY